MTNAPLLDLIAARAARDAGIERVTGHLDPAWKLRYRALAELFLHQRAVGETFKGEDIRFFCRRRGLPEPHHPNAWGGSFHGVCNRWIKAAQVEVDGMAQAHSVASHSHDYKRYRVLR